MNYFIKLTSMVINKVHITKIIHHQSKYYVYTTSNDIHGLMLFASGGLSKTYNTIEICATKNKQDYDIITDFINKIN